MLLTHLGRHLADQSMPLHSCSVAMSSCTSSGVRTRRWSWHPRFDGLHTGSGAVAAIWVVVWARVVGVHDEGFLERHGHLLRFGP